MGYGDELMAAGDARRMMRTDPRRVRVVDRHGRPRWHELWNGNARIARVDEQGDFQTLVNGSGARPYHTHYTDERWYYARGYRATPAELYIPGEDVAFGARYAGRIIVEPHLKSRASPNKQWGWVRWNKLVWLMGRAGLRATQLGPPGTAMLEGAELIETTTFWRAAAVLLHARAAVLPEGGLHHAAAALGVPAVVLFGGFTPVELTGYATHHNLGAGFDDTCGMRTACEHCAGWMARYTPEEICALLLSLITAKRDEKLQGSMAA